MESSKGWPTPEEAAVALAEAEASRTMLARGVVPAVVVRRRDRRGHHGADRHHRAGSCRHRELGAVVAAAGGRAGVVLVAGIEVARFRRLNGVWLGGFASRVVGGTATAASTSYVLSLGAAVWAAFDRAWWVVALCAAAGGVAYAWSGRRWLRIYRAEPAAHGRGESAAVLAVLVIVAIAGLVLPLVGR
jgi:hypothetical protein